MHNPLISVKKKNAFLGGTPRFFPVLTCKWHNWEILKQQGDRFSFPGLRVLIVQVDKQVAKWMMNML